MKHKNYLLIDSDADYPFGVIAMSENRFDELHGPFASKTEAQGYVRALNAEYSDYSGFKVVKIEVPAA